jgi:uncharacterized coiled-coil protein SlyX
MSSGDSPEVTFLMKRLGTAEKKLEKKEEELKALNAELNPKKKDVSDMNAEIAELEAEVKVLSERILAQYALDEAKAELKALENKKSDAELESRITEQKKVVATCRAKVESFSAPATGGTLHELIAELCTTWTTFIDSYMSDLHIIVLCLVTILLLLLAGISLSCEQHLYSAFVKCCL